MPYTLAHPLFAEPLRKVFPYLSSTGLILGSMGPDLEYFIAMQPFRSIGHSLTGFFLLVVPMCLAFALAFHRIIKPALPTWLPDLVDIRAYASELSRPWPLSKWRDWIRFILSLFIGFLTHVFVDHFTHSSGWFVQRLPFLQQMVMGDYVYHILQMSLSLIGLAAPCIYFLYSYSNWRLRQKKLHNTYQQQSSLTHWGVLFIFAMPMLLTKLMGASSFFSISIWVVAPITSAVFGLFVTSLIIGAAQLGRIRIGIFFALMLIIAMIVYKICTYHTEFSVESWVLYNIVLSTMITVGSVCCSSRRMN